MDRNFPVGRAVGGLERLTTDQAWLAVLGATAAIAVLERILPGIGLGPLYIPVICVASWRLGARPGCLTAAVAAMLMAIMTPGLIGAHAALFSFGKFAIGFVIFVYIASLITSFRQAYDRERYLARRDRMTGALNHECFREHTRATLAMAKAKGQTLVLTMLDFDNFKEVNSTHGHVAGDAVLRDFARAARSIIRREDELGRLGGDEFAVLAAVHTAEEAKAFATALHARLSDLLTAGPVPVTCSMGALVIPPENRDAEAELLHQADMLLYAAKQNGKNALHIGWCDAGTSKPTVTEPLRLLGKTDAITNEF